MLESLCIGHLPCARQRESGRHNFQFSMPLEGLTRDNYLKLEEFGVPSKAQASLSFLPACFLEQRASLRQEQTRHLVR